MLRVLETIGLVVYFAGTLSWGVLITHRNL
jgi:hypothetical protein